MNIKFLSKAISALFILTLCIQNGHAQRDADRDLKLFEKDLNTLLYANFADLKGDFVSQDKDGNMIYKCKPGLYGFIPFLYENMNNIMFYASPVKNKLQFQPDFYSVVKRLTDSLSIGQGLFETQYPYV